MILNSWNNIDNIDLTFIENEVEVIEYLEICLIYENNII